MKNKYNNLKKFKNNNYKKPKKEIRKQINLLRNEFQSIDKNKDSFLTKEELKEFFNKNNVKIYLYYNIKKIAKQWNIWWWLYRKCI